MPNRKFWVAINDLPQTALVLAESRRCARARGRRCLGKQMWPGGRAESGLAGAKRGAPCPQRAYGGTVEAR
jgi:hypothetical protein